MLRAWCLTAALFGPILLATAAAVPRPQTSPRALEARFIGHMAFSMTDGEVTLVSDFPYRIGYAGAVGYDKSELRRIPRTLALITHRHADHWERSLFEPLDWQVLGPPDVSAGLPAERALARGHKVSFGPMQIEVIQTPHHDLTHYSYIVNWAGRRLYFSGDTESADSLANARNLDVAFVSPWQLQALSRRGGRADARRMIIYHHEPGATVPGCGGEACTVPRPGDRFTF